MKIISTIIIIILLITVAWFSWDKMNKEESMVETSEQVLDNATQADTTDEIEIKFDSIDMEGNSSSDFDSVDAEIKSI
jgi:uncharacterized protein YxeA